METIVPFSISEFLTDYKAARNKDEEALAISKAFEKVHVEQVSMVEKNKKEVIDEVNPKELLTRAEFHQEMAHYATKKDLETAKMGIIGWVLLGVWAPIIVFILTQGILKHLGS